MTTKQLKAVRKILSTLSYKLVSANMHRYLNDDVILTVLTQDDVYSYIIYKDGDTIHHTTGELMFSGREL